MPCHWLYILILLGILLPVKDTFGQTREYEIFWGDDKIGEIKATRNIAGDNTVIKVTSNTEFKVITSYKRHSEMVARYKNGVLDYSLSKTYMNEKQKGKSILNTMPQGNYLCQIDDDKPFHFKEKIDFSCSSLYYYEPVKKTRLFSETYLDFATVEDLGNNKYLVTLPGGKENTYTYKNGELTEVFVDRMTFNLRFVLKKS